MLESSFMWGGWDRLLSICDPIHRDFKLEFLASFAFDTPAAPTHDANA